MDVRQIRRKCQGRKGVLERENSLGKGLEVRSKACLETCNISQGLLFCPKMCL